MNVAVIKKTRDLGKLSLFEVMAIIKSCNMDDKQREINHVTSYQSANLGASTNSAFSALPAQQASSSSSIPMASPVPSAPSPASKSTFLAPTIPKGAEQNLAMMADLDQIHPDDVEEMDISWHIAMPVFREKSSPSKREETIVVQTETNIWALISLSCGATTITSLDILLNIERALVAQQFMWEDQMQALNLAEDGGAHLAQIEGDMDVDAAKEQMMDLQIGFMVSTTPANTENSKKKLKPLQEMLDAKTSDFNKLQEDYSIKSSHLKFANKDIAKLTSELDALKVKYNDVDFTIKKFDASSAVVESRIEHTLKWQNKHGEGFGYEMVPPPFNNYFTPSIDNQERQNNPLHPIPFRMINLAPLRVLK
ncbi:hypothetical protein L2E82_44657 [Cichorium intybus]|uniref:Uncharacterized protein n=1 Tax=Cichorium intybus TaxID=13427 RepID=A0ACB8ZR17_CICIN|nr:hypothetical protein L2E82_44657 [Cichorium intybus]